jgi:arylsulfatase A-like enzyme
MSRLGAHRYLRAGFRFSDTGRAMLIRRYHRAAELMDRKLEVFFEEALARGLLDDTLLILTSDHGEAFGEHDLFLHDASVYDTHLRVPLWVHHPMLGSALIDDVVSTRDLFDLMSRAASGDVLTETILDEDYRHARPIAHAEHFYYPNSPDALPRFRVNQAAAIARDRKVIVRGDRAEIYQTETDPNEQHGTEVKNLPQGSSGLEAATTILKAA